MSEAPLPERIKERVFLLDGAMGTQLIARGVEVGTCSDYLNIEWPDIVCDADHAYRNWLEKGRSTRLQRRNLALRPRRHILPLRA